VIGWPEKEFVKKYARNGVRFHVTSRRPSILGRAQAATALRVALDKIRVLTAMAMGFPVVANPIAAEG